MIEYIEKKRSISDSLTENLRPIDDEDLISYILGGLDWSYGPFITAFMMKTKNLIVDALAGFLLHEESRLEQEHLRLDTTTQYVPALTVNRSNPHQQNTNTGSGSNFSNVSRNQD